MPKLESKRVKSKKVKSKSQPLVVSDYIPDGYVLPVPNTTPHFDFVHKKTKAIKRPPNSFFIFRSEFRRQEIGRDSQSDVSKLASIVWKRMSNEDKRPWYRLQLEVKAKHNALYPGYKYRPRDKNKDEDVIDEDDDEDDEDYEDDEEVDEDEDEDEGYEPADEPASSASRAAGRARPYPPPDQRHLFMGYPGAPGEVGFNQGYMAGPKGAHRMQMYPIPGAGVNGYFPPSFLPVMGPPNAVFQLENIPDDQLLKEMKRRADITMLRKAEAARKEQMQQQQKQKQRVADLRDNPYVAYLQNPVGGAGLRSVAPGDQTASSSKPPSRVMAASNQGTTLPPLQPALDLSMPLPTMMTMPIAYPQPAPNQGTQGLLANTNMPGQSGQKTMMPNWVERSETDWYVNKLTYQAGPYYNPLPYPLINTTDPNPNPVATNNVTTDSSNSLSCDAPELDLSVIDPQLLGQGSPSLQSQTQSQPQSQLQSQSQPQVNGNGTSGSQNAEKAADAGNASYNWCQEASSSNSQGPSAISSGQTQAVQQQLQPFHQQLILPNYIPSASHEQTSATQLPNYFYMNSDSNVFNQNQSSPFNANSNTTAFWGVGSEPSAESEL